MSAFDALARGEHGDPFSFLGIHPSAEGDWLVRAYLPWAAAVDVLVGSRRIPMEAAPVEGEGAWVASVRDLRRSRRDEGPPPYRLAARGADGQEHTFHDPYAFGPLLDEARVWEFVQGRDRRAHEYMGAHPVRVGSVHGTRFAVWAPGARAVSVVGDWNGWDGRSHPMRARGMTGVWELFLPGVDVGARYKFQIRTAAGEVLEKSDPFGRFAEVRPATASIVAGESGFVWSDADWLERRSETQAGQAPMSVYEVHLGSWRRHADGSWLGYRALADRLLPYVQDLGFTHVELLPLTEHPLDASWGYQPVGYFSPTSRFGGPDDLRYFVDRAHALGIGVLLDWVPGHFPKDEHGLARFDGTALFEPADPRRAAHPDWGTLVFEYGSPAVQAFLISSAFYWLEEFHIDGLRFDAVASMLYLDYSRAEGEWTPNAEGGNTDLDAIAFLRRLNDAVHEEIPGAITVAEESTAWEGVSHPTWEGGLGFDQKWNMGWMNDTLEIMRDDPVYRSHKHGKLTFSMVYAFNERFVLPLSHDEVVHGKGSLLGKMPGDDAERFAHLRLLFAYQWLHPGKKLLFMGGELGQWAEWDEDASVDWALEGFETHRGVRRLVRDLNVLHSQYPALHALDFAAEGFEWLVREDAEHSTLAFLRWAPEWTAPVVAVLNFTPVCREGYRVPVPAGGRWRVVLNSDAPDYAGRGTLVDPVFEAEPAELNGRSWVVTVRLPGLAALVLVPDS